MNEGCPGCIASARGQDEEFEKAKAKAIEYSKENKVPVAIYKEGNEWKIAEAFGAYGSGLGPAIREVVSQHSGIAT